MVGSCKVTGRVLLSAEAWTSARDDFFGVNIADLVVLEVCTGVPSAIPSYEWPCIFPRIATPLTHLRGLLSKHSTPPFSHLAHGVPDWSH